MSGQDNGDQWPDAAMTPFRSEKDTNWEGAFRVPAMIRWPGRIKPGSVTNDIFGSHDWFPTLLAAAGDPDAANRLLQGWKIGDRTYKVHIDGYNQLAFLTGQQDHSERRTFIYFDDDGQLVALRVDNWKLVFYEQKTPGTLDIRGEPFTARRVPLIFNLRMDPYERAVSSVWSASHRGRIRRHAERLSAAAEAAELQSRSGHAATVASCAERLMMIIDRQ
jgi:arylsulfatase A-like enzyme